MKKHDILKIRRMINFTKMFTEKYFSNVVV